VSLREREYDEHIADHPREPNEPSSKEPHRGFGYVEFEDPEDCKDAIDNMDQAELFGKVIKVNQAKPQKNANEGLGSKTALWEQVGLILRQHVSLFKHKLIFVIRRVGLPITL
jgi:RNA recognition motif-containing protein